MGKLSRASPFAILVASLVAAGPPPATQSTGDMLPPAAVRRIGDIRLGTIFGTPVAFSPDGNWLLTNGDRSNLWEATTGRELTETNSAAAGNGVGFIDDRTLLVNRFDYVNGFQPRSTLKLVDAVSGRTVRELPLPEPNGAGVPAVSTDGRFAVVFGQRFTLIDTAAGHVIADLGPAAGGGRLATQLRTSAACFSADGSRLLVIRLSRPPGDGLARQTEPLLAYLYDGHTGRPLPFDPVDASAGGAISPDGRVLVTASSHGRPGSGRSTLQAYDVPPSPAATTRPTALVPVSLDATDGGRRSEEITRFAFAPTGCRVAWVGRAEPAPVVVCDLSVRPVSRPWVVFSHVRSAEFLVWSPDGRTVAVAGFANRPELVDVATGRPRFPAPLHLGQVTAMDPSPDGRSLVVGDVNGTVVRWDLDTGDAAAVHRDGEPRLGNIAALAYARDGSGLTVAGGFGRVELVDPLTLEARHIDASRKQARGMAAAADGRTVAQEGEITDGRATITVWDMPTGVDRRRLAQDKCNGDEMVFAADGTRLAVLHEGVMSLWDLVDPSGRPVTCVGPDRPEGLAVPGAACFSPDGRWVAALGDACHAYSVGPTAGDVTGSDGVTVRKPFWSGPTYNGWSSVAFSSTGALLAVAEAGGFRGGVRVGVGGGASLFEPGTPDRPGAADSVCRVSDHDRTVLHVAFVPGRPLLATAGDDGTILVWDLRTAIGDDQTRDRSDAQLWDDLAGTNPVAAYQAGFVLADRGQLVSRSRSLTSAPVDSQSAWASLIGELSSPNRRRRDAAHKKLEAAGPAAATAVRRALAAHPGGETEARLSDLVRLAGGGHSGLADATSRPPAPAVPDAEAVRRRRVLQLLDWANESTDARAAADRLRGTAPATQP